MRQDRRPALADAAGETWTFGLDRGDAPGSVPPVGVNLSLIMGHDLGAGDLMTLSSRLTASTAMRRAAGRLWLVMKPRWRSLSPVEAFATAVAAQALDERQTLRAWDMNEAPSLEWAGFSLYIGRHSLEATHLEKLAGFVLDLDGLQGPLRACGRALAAELGSPAVMYGPDSASAFELVSEGVRDGRTLDELLHLAEVQLGPPAEDIRSMADEHEALRLVQRCYVTERL